MTTDTASAQNEHQTLPPASRRFTCNLCGGKLRHSKSARGSEPVCAHCKASRAPVEAVSLPGEMPIASHPNIDILHARYGEWRTIPPTGPAIDSEHRDFPACPHCGCALCDPVDMPQSVDLGEMDCDECGGECTWERNVTITYSTRPQNAGSHQRLPETES